MRPSRMTWSPASTTCSIAHSNQAATFENIGQPADPLAHATAANLSSTGRANVFDTSFCVSDSTLIAKCGVHVMVAKLRHVLARQTRSKGGLSENDVKEFAVKPIGFPSPSQAVT